MTHFSKKYLINYKILMDFLGLLFIGLFILITTVDPEKEEFIILSNPIILVIFIGTLLLIFLLLAFYRFLYWKYAYYEIRENDIFTVKGIIFKKNSFLEFKKIHTVNKKQNFIQKWFNIGTLLIDSGSTNTAFNAEITIFEDDDKLTRLMKIIDLKQNKGLNLSNLSENQLISNNNIDNDKINLYNFNIKNKFIYTFVMTLLTSLIFLFLLVILITTLLVLTIFININYKDVVDIILYVLFSIISFIVMGLLVSFLLSFVNFYDYNIIKDKDSINISYGLFVKNTNRFKTNKVKAVIVKENLIERLFNLASIDVEVIGYGENNGNKQVSRTLIPLCRKNEVDYYLNLIFPEYQNIKKIYATKNYFSLISYFLLFPAIIYGLIMVLVNTWLISLQLNDAIIISDCIITVVFIFYLLFISAKKSFAYYNQGIGINEKGITIYHGDFTRSRTTILKENIIGITEITTPFRKKRDIYSFVVHFKSNSEFNTVKVHSISHDVYKQVYNLITL